MMFTPAKEPSILSLIVLSAFASMGAIVITPGIPKIAEFFDIRIGTAQLTMTAFLLGYALGQLLYGPIANRLGRKPAFYVGIVIATIGSLFSILAKPVESFHLLLVGRVLEALGSSVGLVVCFTIINDFYQPQHIRRVTSLLMMAFAIVPGIGIATGAFLIQHFGWQSCFYFLLGYGLLLFLLTFYLPETLKQKDLNALRHRYLICNYVKVLRIKKLVGYALMVGCSGASLYIFSAEGPYIGIHVLGYSPSVYGLFGLIPLSGTLVGSLALLKLTHLEPKKVIGIGILLELAGTLIMLGCFVGGWVNLYTLLGPTILLFMGNVMLVANGLSLAIAQSDDKANASAIANFLLLATAMLGTLIFGMLHIPKPWIMPTLFLAFIGGIGLSYHCLVRDK